MTLTARVAAAALALLLAAAGGWRAGVVYTQGRWDAAELNRTREAGRRAAINADRAWEASAAHERTRAASAAALRKARDELQAALSRPIDCPASGRIGDLVLPVGSLGGVLNAAGQSADPAAAGKP